MSRLLYVIIVICQCQYSYMSKALICQDPYIIPICHYSLLSQFSKSTQYRCDLTFYEYFIYVCYYSDAMDIC
ncbi:hypothetical protein C1646_685339 [Rhizophagus diaphanus]|nr:hypothetical protein C1646_685339 [Rhizophagus diaphanus] [Rhizophagus sp. MUCL 43196]